MRSETKEFLEHSVLCAAVIGMIFHLNSKLTPETENATIPIPQKTEMREQVDSVAIDTLKNVPITWAKTLDQKKR